MHSFSGMLLKQLHASFLSSPHAGSKCHSCNIRPSGPLLHSQLSDKMKVHIFLKHRKRGDTTAFGLNQWFPTKVRPWLCCFGVLKYHTLKLGTYIYWWITYSLHLNSSGTSKPKLWEENFYHNFPHFVTVRAQLAHAQSQESNITAMQRFISNTHASVRKLISGVSECPQTNSCPALSASYAHPLRSRSLTTERHCSHVSKKLTGAITP